MIRCPLNSFGPVKLSIAFCRYEICCLYGWSWVGRRAGSVDDLLGKEGEQVSSNIIQVHRGFWSSLSALMGNLEAFQDPLKNIHQNIRLYLERLSLPSNVN